MGAQKKFKDNYPLDPKTKSNNVSDKVAIKAYLEKIARLLDEPATQQKAAEIISQMINNKK